MTALDWPIISSPVLDDMPEFYHYEDTGCEVSGACLDCPLPQCKYDDPASVSYTHLTLPTKRIV